MAYRYGDRTQAIFFPPSIEDYIAKDDPVRVYSTFVDNLNFEELGITLNQHKVGNSEYDPKAMLKLLVYGTSYGIRSSRKLERAVHHNISFIWLVGGLKPDHKTIAEFRRRNKNAIRKTLKQSVRICIELGLIEGNILFVDGTKIRGNAGIKNTWSKDRCERQLNKIDKRIEVILRECEEVDEKEKGQKSLIKMDEELKDQALLKEKVKTILKEINDTGEKTINSVDKECSRYNSIEGSHAGYNAQVVTDEKHGLIVNSDVTGDNNDLKQFARQVEQANEIIEKKCKVACADAGYSNHEELKEIDDQNIKVIVPNKKQASHKEISSFDKDNFVYDKVKDEYICPEGQVLEYRGKNKWQKAKRYIIRDKKICRRCKQFGVCTSSKRGRHITQYLDKDFREKIKNQYETEESKKIYSLRQQKAELPFGHIKHNLGIKSFLLRGKKGVNAEMALMAVCFNLTRMTNILGITEVLEKMKG